jgi:hypothetical protein
MTYNRQRRARKFANVFIDSAFNLDAIVERGVDALMRMNPSPECLRAIEAIEDAIRYDSFSDIADAVVTAWEYYGDMMYEQERENWAYHLVDPILDAINGPQSFSKQKARKFASEYDRVSDLPEDYELITDSQDIEATLDNAGKSQYSGDAGCLFISYEDPDGGNAGFRLFLCENSVPGNNDSVWEIYPNDTYGG